MSDIYDPARFVSVYVECAPTTYGEFGNEGGGCSTNIVYTRAQWTALNAAWVPVWVPESTSSSYSEYGADNYTTPGYWTSPPPSSPPPPPSDVALTTMFVSRWGDVLPLETWFGWGGGMGIPGFATPNFNAVMQILHLLGDVDMATLISVSEDYYLIFHDTYGQNYSADMNNYSVRSVIIQRYISATGKGATPTGQAIVAYLNSPDYINAGLADYYGPVKQIVDAHASMTHAINHPYSVISIAMAAASVWGGGYAMGSMFDTMLGNFTVGQLLTSTGPGPIMPASPSLSQAVSAINSALKQSGLANELGIQDVLGTGGQVVQLIGGGIPVESLNAVINATIPEFEVSALVPDLITETGSDYVPFDFQAFADVGIEPSELIDIPQETLTELTNTSLSFPDVSLRDAFDYVKQGYKTYDAFTKASADTPARPVVSPRPVTRPATYLPQYLAPSVRPPISSSSITERVNSFFNIATGQYVAQPETLTTENDSLQLSQDSGKYLLWGGLGLLAILLVAKG